MLNDDLPDDTPLPISDLLPTMTGRVISTKGLLERIIDQFRAEVDEAQVIAFSSVEQRTRVRDVAQYVMAVESVALTLDEQAYIIRQAASELLGFGGLDELFHDDRITTILVEGNETLAVRYAPGSDLVALPPLFDNQAHVRRIADRLLLTAGIPADADNAIVETGLLLDGRHASLNVVMPPYVTQVRADIRLHPRQVPTLDEWIERGYLDAKAAHLLRVLATSSHGLMIVGDTESGKTTLLNIMAHLLPQTQGVSVERAGEMRLPDHIHAYQVGWAGEGVSGRTLAECVDEALLTAPSVLLLDEVRADEPDAIAPLLLNPAPRLIWSVRGTSEPRRVKSALSIIVQRACGAGMAALDTLFERLPFMVMVKRRRGTIQLIEIAEWQWVNDTTELVPLLQHRDGAYHPSGKSPVNLLALDDTFWRLD